MKALYFAFAGLLCLTGCGTSRHVETTATSHERTARVAVDTVRVSDTVRVAEYARDSVIVERRGDTVYVDRWHERKASSTAVAIKERASIARDTVVRTDTVVKMVADRGKKQRSMPTGLLIVVCGVIAVSGAMILTKRIS